jgi:hypothetical protein
MSFSSHLLTRTRTISRSILLAVLCVCAVTASATAANTHQTDVVVYGDASGGVTAAVQAARMGKKVILVSQYGHLGGLTSSGLGWTDIGNTAILGGLSREFYHEVYMHYENDAAWKQQKRSEFATKGQGAKTFNSATKLASVFEPKVAEAIFDQMIKKSGVIVIQGRLDLKNGVHKTGKLISKIMLEDGSSVKGKMFIDASYEGDLLAGAGISFMIGREPNALYDEVGNGNTGPSKKNQLRKGIDPYVVKGDAKSGLLPGVNPDMGGKKGDGDKNLQAYCYRMVLTNAEGNRVAIKKPDGYDAKNYELLFRSIEAGQKWGFFKTSPMPNKKTDSNNVGGISTDFIGENYGKDWDWSTLDHKEREALAARHRDWQLGMIWTLQNHPRVPEKIRTSHAQWGLAKDEFQDNGNWPYNIYVREARRMKSSLVMTEAHCKNKILVADPVGMGAYTLDSHNTQRFVHNGMIMNEGDIQTHIGGKPYGISYRSIVPDEQECENLLVPWALSATHIAFGSIRMEPVFMVLGQSSGTAACLAIDAKSSVQAIPYNTLRTRLLKDDQRLP